MLFEPESALLLVESVDDDVVVLVVSEVVPVRLVLSLPVKRGSSISMAAPTTRTRIHPTVFMPLRLPYDRVGSGPGVMLGNLR